MLKTVLAFLALIPSASFAAELDVDKLISEINEAVEPMLAQEPEPEFLRPQDVQVLYAKAEGVKLQPELVKDSDATEPQDLVFDKGSYLLRRDTRALFE